MKNTMITASAPVPKTASAPVPEAASAPVPKTASAPVPVPETVSSLLAVLTASGDLLQVPDLEQRIKAVLYTAEPEEGIALLGFMKRARITRADQARAILARDWLQAIALGPAPEGIATVTIRVTVAEEGTSTFEVLSSTPVVAGAVQAPGLHVVAGNGNGKGAVYYQAMKSGQKAAEIAKKTVRVSDGRLGINPSSVHASAVAHAEKIGDADFLAAHTTAAGK